ncbi:MAG: response regulator [Bacteroidota bacterium]
MSCIMVSRECLPQVLVVDGDPLSRLLLASLLRRRGCAVTEDGDGDNALGRLHEISFDLVILGMMVSGMSGIKLCHRVRDELGLVELPVVAYTAHDDLARIAQMRLAGFNSFLFKPVDGFMLDGILEKVMIRQPERT